MPGSTPPGDITRLLSAAREGDREALGRLFDLVYDELHRLARRQMSGGETVRATALVNELYLRMARAEVTPEDRAHFFSTAARAMRQILVDHARRKQAAKRGGGIRPGVLDEERAGGDVKREEILAVDAALTRLEELDERLARLVEMRFYAGLSVEEVAGALGVSDRTVKRDWRKARAFLYRELGGAAAAPA